MVLTGYKTYIAAVGALISGLYLLSTGNAEMGMELFLGGLAALGIRDAIGKTK